MILKSLNIISFGGLRNRKIDLSDGVNVIFGENESGKSSAAMFIKFIFYGLSAKSNKALGTSERSKYINRETSQAAGFIIAESFDGTLWRIERLLIASDNSPARERVRITNQSTGECVTGQNPGEFFFGVPEDVFVGTCFVSQSAEIRPSISGLGKTGGSVENLLTSADENINIKRALDLIDNTRRAICHKNSSGGELTSLREKKGALIAELKNSAEKSSEIISLSSSLDDIKNRIAEMEEAKERYDGILSALEKVNLGRKIESSVQTGEKIEKLEKSLSDLDSSPFGIGFEETLLESERDIRAYDEECAAFDEMLASAEDEEHTFSPEADEIIDEAHRLDASSKIRFSVATALLIAGLLGLGASFLMYYYNTGLYTLPLIMTLILVVLGVVFIILHAKAKNSLTAILDEWDAESISEIEIAVSEKMNVLGRGGVSRLEKERMIQSLDAAKLRFDAAVERVNSLAEESDIEDTGDIYETISILHDISDSVKEKRGMISSKIENLKGRLDVIGEQLAGINLSEAELDAYTAGETEYGKIALSLDSEAISNLLKEKEFTDSALRSASKRKSTLEEKLLEMGKPTRSPDEYSTMISSIDERMEELTLRFDACELASSALPRAGEAMRSDVIPKIAEKASHIISKSTPHEKIAIDKAFNCSIADEESHLSTEILSKGTADLTYIALRIALADEVFRSESPTLIFDESFAHIDMGRLEKLFSVLNSNEDSSQHIIFTCRRDESLCAEKMGMNIVSL